MVRRHPQSTLDRRGRPEGIRLAIEIYRREADTAEMPFTRSHLHCRLHACDRGREADLPCSCRQSKRDCRPVNGTQFQGVCPVRMIPPPGRKLIAVGTPITERPPHRSEHAQFTHSAPTSGV